MHFLVLLISVLFLITEGGTFCEEKPNWTKGIIYDGLKDFILDCEGFQVKLNLLASSSVPEDIASFTIKNCCKLTLEAVDFKILPKLKRLKIVNILELLITKDSFSTCLPPNVILENIGHVNELNFPHRIEPCDGLTLISLFLKNISISTLSKNFTKAFGRNLKHLEMEHIHVEIAESDSLKLENKNAVVKVSKSLISVAEAGFLNINVSEVTFFENKIKNFNETDTIISLEANKVIFNGNKMKALNKTMKIISHSLQMTKNSFDRINKDAFDDVLPKPGVTDSFMNFSRNTINSLSPTSSEKENTGNSVFANLTVQDNRLQCDCKVSIALNWSKSKNFLRRRFFPLDGKTNRSKYWNTPDYDLHHVLMIYNDLCKFHYCKTEEKSEALEIHNIDGKESRHELGQNQCNHLDEVIEKKPEPIPSYYPDDKCVLLAIIVGLIVTFTIACIFCVIWHKKVQHMLICI